MPQGEREGVGGYSATKPSLSSRLAKQLDAEKFIGEQLRLPPTPNEKTRRQFGWEKIEEESGECEGLPHPFMGRRGVAHFCVIEAI